MSYDFIDYRLCNETSMKNNSDSYLIDIDLDQIYCIDMEDLDMGGSWDNDFINYVEFDLYACKNGIDYDEKMKIVQLMKKSLKWLLKTIPLNLNCITLLSIISQ